MTKLCKSLCDVHKGYSSRWKKTFCFPHGLLEKEIMNHPEECVGSKKNIHKTHSSILVVIATFLSYFLTRKKCLVNIAFIPQLWSNIFTSKHCSWSNKLFKKSLIENTKLTLHFQFIKKLLIKTNFNQKCNSKNYYFIIDFKLISNQLSICVLYKSNVLG